MRVDVCQSSTTEHSRSETGTLNGCLSPQARSSLHRTTLQCLRGVDGDGRAVTIGYALAPQEDTLSYVWFLDLIKSLEICDGLSFGSVFNCKGTVVFSDRQKGLGAAVRDLCSESTHCACCFHLLENTRKRDRALEPKTFWWVQAAVTVQEFDTRMQTWSQTSPDAVRYLQSEIDTGTIWTTYQHIEREVRTWGWRTSNLSEIVNSRLLSTRTFPALALMLQPDNCLSTLYELRRQHANWCVKNTQ
jgi:transposase-like protein